MFGNCLQGIDKQFYAHLLVGVPALCWTLWLSKNDVIFNNKCKIDLMSGPRSMKLSTLVLTALLLLLYGAGKAHCSVFHDNNTDRQALLDFKEAIIEDPRGALRSWNQSVDHCMWLGVNCSRRHPGRVTVLDLYDLGLAGQITPSLGNLTFLKELFLEYNLLEGNIPYSLTNCTKLQQLDLSYDGLVGSIPQNIGYLSRLSGMNLAGNKLTGKIPSTFNNITYINMLSGTLPSNISLPNLQFLFLGENRLEGHIPDSLGNASFLEGIDLNSKSFTGQIPSYLGKLHNLNILKLGQNKLEARDNQSWDFLDALSQCPLEIFSLYGNQLHGLLPNSIGNLSITLQRLNLGQNNLFGTVPPTIGNYFNLIG
ncbi:hypothetical protein ZWY2020_021037 [Hordeum vulgare]|nr:hypothetical protein ZWY2020_021037 [Hordeum vulgare]